MSDARNLGPDSRLSDLRRDFLATSTRSMPVAGMIFWLVTAGASRVLDPQQLAYLVGFGSGTVFPLGMLIDRLRGIRPIQGKTGNPVMTMFLQCLGLVVLLWPLVILAGVGQPELIVLGAAILMGLVWIPYGWAADDRVGLHHTIFRSLGCYAAYLFAPAPWRVLAICGVVLLAYAYSFLFMRRL